MGLESLAYWFVYMDFEVKQMYKMCGNTVS